MSDEGMVTMLNLYAIATLAYRAGMVKIWTQYAKAETAAQAQSLAFQRLRERYPPERGYTNHIAIAEIIDFDFIKDVLESQGKRVCDIPEA